ncbi:MAG: hypothetical protein VX970_07465 [Planctomycetota bacterium]|nr:hypothetical protein [Planctomycetota bacterium]
MTVASQKIGHTRWVVPEEDRSLYVGPAPNQLTSTLNSNRELLWKDEAHRGYDFQGYRFSELLELCRADLLQKAIRYTRAYRNVSLPRELQGRTEGFRGPIILGGHQPELFHPGVWAKNFVIDRWARENAGVALQILIDTDVPKSLGIHVPGGSLTKPTVEYLPFEHRSERVSYEAWQIRDNAEFDSFGDRVRERVAPLIDDPFIDHYWPRVIERAKNVRQVGLCLAQARHQFEAGWGLQTLELPQSEICKGDAFRWFTAHILAHLPRFHEIYNSALFEYRKQNRLRNHAHPVPDLASGESGLQAPFWIWADEDPQRQPLHCQYQGDQLLLAGNKGVTFAIQATPEGDLHTAVEQLAEAESQGIHIRSRALMTTMFARLFCGDLFVHGIGGANYDRLTDTIIDRFFGFQPPGYMVVSGTLRLPLEGSGVTVEEIRRCDASLRDFVFNPDRLLKSSGDVPISSQCQAWIKEKKQWLDTPLTNENGSTRHEAIERCNRAIQPFALRLAQATETKRKNLIKKMQADTILGARDYAFCLFPEHLLAEFLLDTVRHSL